MARMLAETLTVTREIQGKTKILTIKEKIKAVVFIARQEGTCNINRIMKIDYRIYVI